MSLFGGDSPSSRQLSPVSDFSISPISSPSHESHEQNNRSGDTHNREVQHELSPGLSASEENDRLEDVEDLNYQGSSERAAGGGDEQATDTDRHRFQGSDGAWRYHTTHERMLADSLVQLQDRDLSIHLYNAHAWKARLRSQDSSITDVSRSKKHWISHKSGGSKPWYPDKQWTHWPLNPNAGVEAADVVGDPATPARTTAVPLEQVVATRYNLEEDLGAMILRTAKEQWYRRQSSSPSSRRKQPRRSATTPSAVSGSDIEYSTASDYEGYTSDMSVPSENSIRHSRSNPTAGLVISADDEMSRRLLQPTVSTMLSRVDKLLMALHHNREGHFALARDSDAEESRASSLSRSQSRSVRRSGSRVRTVRNHAPKYQSDSLEIDASLSASPNNQRGRKRSRRSQSSRSPEQISKRPESDDSLNSDSSSSEYARHQRQPRDWSEVLGIAAMTGWPDVVVQRTLQRCQRLFGESMQFRILGEGPASAVDPISAGPLTGDATEATIEAPSATTTVTIAPSYRCPEVTCHRHTLPFPITQGYRFREHMRRSHMLNKDQIQELELAQKTKMNAGPVSVNNPRGWVPPQPLSCPHPGCKMSKSTFSEPRRLVEHLRRVHKYDPRREAPPPAQSEAESSHASEIETDDEMVGGVHNDGFLRPIGRRVGKRGKNKPKEKV